MICMKGKIYYQSDRNRWRVVWYDNKTKKNIHIYRYNGHFMPCTAFKKTNGKEIKGKNGTSLPDKNKCTGYKIADKLRSAIQSRYEQSQRGECIFRIEEFTRDHWTDTIEYYQKWLDDVIKPGRKPATIKGYQSYLKNWIKPFFTKYPVRLHEIEYDTLMKFLRFIMDGLNNKEQSIDPKTDTILNVHKANPEFKSPALKRLIKKEYNLTISESWIRRVVAKEKNFKETSISKTSNVGKSAMNIMSSLHAMMDHANRSKRIPVIPPFPKKAEYDLKGKDIDYLTPEDFKKIFNQIPKEHQPIFKFLQLHFRRPSEACALLKTDFDPINEYFKIHRSISARKIVDSVKTNRSNPTIHRIVCDQDFIDTAKRLSMNSESPFMFVNPRARKKGGRYTLESLRNIWYKACDDAGVKRIWTYRGLKHTACMEFIENGGTGDELMTLTDHKNRESVDQYIEITLKRKKMAMTNAKRRKEAAAQRNKEHCQNIVNIIPFPKQM